MYQLLFNKFYKIFVQNTVEFTQTFKVSFCQQSQFKLLHVYDM